MEEVGQLDFPEKGFGAGGLLWGQQDKDSENVGKLMDSGEEGGKKKKRSKQVEGREEVWMEVPGHFDKPVVHKSKYSSLGDWDYDDF